MQNLMRLISWRALLCLCLGFVFSGIGASLYIYCGLGADAFNVLNQGLARSLGIQVGTASCLTQGVLLALVLPFGKPYLGVGTLLGSFLIGCVMNVCAIVFSSPLQTANLALRLCFLALAPFFVGFGIALVRRSNLGLTPYDVVPLLLHRKTHNLAFFAVRISVDAFSLLIGTILGGTIGIGTILSVVLTGPAIQIAAAILAYSKKVVRLTHF